jgi:hypothetical protein
MKSKSKAVDPRREITVIEVNVALLKGSTKIRPSTHDEDID